MADTATVATLPPCDFCSIVHQRTRSAVIDGRTLTGQWANMCDDHWSSHGIGQLGTGYGQRLILAT